MSTDVRPTPPPGPHPLSRRHLLLGTAAGLASVPLTSSGAHADATTERHQRHGVHGEHVGPFRVTPLLDASGAFFMAAHDAFSGASEEDWRRAEDVDPGSFGDDDTWLLDFRCFLVRGPRRHLTLVDTGIGPVGSPASAWAPVPGRLQDALAQVGVEARDVDAVVLSHLHEDHYGGSVHLDGNPVFENARYVVQQAELDAVATGSSADTYVVQPLRAVGLLDAIDGTTRLCRASSRAGSVTAVPTPGHTVGHQSVVVDGRHDQLVITGDVLVHAVQLVNPDVAYAFEQGPELARRTRHRLLRSARRSGARLATAHLHRPFVSAR